MNNYQNEKYTNNSFQNLENQTQDKLCQFSIILQKVPKFAQNFARFQRYFFHSEPTKDIKILVCITNYTILAAREQKLASKKLQTKKVFV